jgi:hypothetical protein
MFSKIKHLTRCFNHPTGKNRLFLNPLDLDTPGGGWTKNVLRGDLRVLSGVQGGFRHSGGGLDLS